MYIINPSFGLMQFRSSLKNSLVHVFFQIALETILLPIQINKVHVRSKIIASKTLLFITFAILTTRPVFNHGSRLGMQIGFQDINHFTRANICKSRTAHENTLTTHTYMRLTKRLNQTSRFIIQYYSGMPGRFINDRVVSRTKFFTIASIFPFRCVDFSIIKIIILIPVIKISLFSERGVSVISNYE